MKPECYYCDTKMKYGWFKGYYCPNCKKSVRKDTQNDHISKGFTPIDEPEIIETVVPTNYYPPVAGGNDIKPGKVQLIDKPSASSEPAYSSRRYDHIPYTPSSGYDYSSSPSSSFDSGSCSSDAGGSSGGGGGCD